MQALLDKCWTKADREKLIRNLAKEANRAPLMNMEAAKLLLAYTFGRPVQVMATDASQPFEVIVRREQRKGTTETED